MAEYYEALGRVVTIDGDRPVDEVTASIVREIDGKAAAASEAR